MLKSIVQDLRTLKRAMVTSPRLVNVNIGNISISSMVFCRLIMCFDVGLEGAVLPLCLHNPFAALQNLYCHLPESCHNIQIYGDHKCEGCALELYNIIKNVANSTI